MKKCAVCGMEIPVGQTYLKVCDNFLQVKFFEEEDESDNVFCSDECLKTALSVMEVEE
jgi:predicted nucleic acid-binding Zn ribbon protein